jgi:hypothetical protein
MSAPVQFPDTLKPILHFRGRDVVAGTWSVSCMLVTREEDPGDLIYKFADSVETLTVPPTKLASFGGYGFFQYSLTCNLSSILFTPVTTLTGNPHVVEYSFAEEAKLRVGTHSFHLPRNHEAGEVNMLFFSCNGVQRDTDKAKMADFGNTWRYAHSKHTWESPIHVAFCGGDYVYCDTVLQLPIVKKWNDLPDATRFSMPFTDPMREAVMQEYFERYVLALIQIPEMAEFQANVPIGCVPDDHDYFDGKGSHSAEYNLCPVYRGIAKCAEFFILLFQNGADPTTISYNKPPGMHGVNSFSLVHVVSPKTVVLSVDHRSERLINEKMPTQSILMTEESENRLFTALEQSIPQGCLHLVVSVFGPIAYSENVIMEDAIDSALLSSVLACGGERAEKLRGPQV